ncbi:winged helix-turn-helix domain-containing protein [Kitasatospora sp. NPDC088346]|uniref:winged helix-turn-helix domain-containing protein n=1 Tax=Kitasatospora sp. NPDC088346 TaxID=3364073 RepID=UPI003801A117
MRDAELKEQILTSALRGDWPVRVADCRSSARYAVGMRYSDGGGLTAKGRRRREVVRVEAAGLLARGVPPREVARRLRVSVKSVYQWQQAWREGGAAALASRGPGGQRCKLSARCLEKLAGYLDQGPASHGWDEDQIWTGARVATLIGRKFHVTYSVSGATRLMRRLGFTPQVPARRAAERDERAVAAWQEVTWAEVKAPGRPATDGSASRTKPGSPAGRPGAARGDGAVSPRL